MFSYVKEKNENEQKNKQVNRAIIYCSINKKKRCFHLFAYNVFFGGAHKYPIALAPKLCYGRTQ